MILPPLVFPGLSYDHTLGRGALATKNNLKSADYSRDKVPLNNDCEILK
jgi:hypothetical protein